MVRHSPVPVPVPDARPWRNGVDRPYDVVAIGASAGGFRAVKEVIAPLTAEFPSSILLVQHLDPHHKTFLDVLLRPHTGLRVCQAEHNALLLPGWVYIAPPDQHMLAGPGKLQLAHTELVHFSRPSIDLLFESVAGVYRDRGIGVLLSGSNRDGAAGIRAIKEAGGITIVQDPKLAEFSAMPNAAVETGCVDYVLPLDSIGATLSQLCLGARAHP